MKVSAAALVLVFLIFASFSLTTAGPSTYTSPCCDNGYLSGQRLSKYHLERFFYTGCPKRSIIFVTNTQELICADPKDDYVQKELEKLNPI